MKRYIFFLLAFFLTFSAYSFSLGRGLIDAPDAKASINSGIRQTSGRNVQELGNISESKEKSMQPGVSEPGSLVILNNEAQGSAPIMNKGTKTSSLSGANCTTFEGKIYSKGEAGYSDCIRTIKNDRQGMKNIP